ncbi:MAG: hotdog domain-containing protein [Acidimicrobiia bacterium]
MAARPDAPDHSRHVLLELGLGLERRGDELHGSAPIVPQMHVPGTDVVRSSVLAIWVDTVAGLLVADVMQPRVPITLELDVHLHAPPHDLDRVHLRGRLAKVGRTVVVPSVDVLDGDGRRLGFGAASFVVAPDPSLRMPDRAGIDGRSPGAARLRVPLAERVGIEHRGPGTVVLPRRAESLNASNTVNGGLLALAVEEAALSLTPGATLASLALRYLQPVRVGPAVAVAEVDGGLGRVEVRDAGADGRCAVLGTTRTA